MEHLELAEDIATSSWNMIQRLTYWSLTQRQITNLEIKSLSLELRPTLPSFFSPPSIIPKCSDKPPLPTDCVLCSTTSLPRLFSSSFPQQPPPPPMMTLMSQLTGKAAMPAPRSEKAPKMFEGNDEDIAEFLDVYERCADDAQLSKTEWVRIMFRYLD